MESTKPADIMEDFFKRKKNYILKRKDFDELGLSNGSVRSAINCLLRLRIISKTIDRGRYFYTYIGDKK